MADYLEALKAVLAEIHGQDPKRMYSVAEVKQLVYSLDAAADEYWRQVAEQAWDECAKAWSKHLFVQGAEKPVNPYRALAEKGTER